MQPRSKEARPRPEQPAAMRTPTDHSSAGARGPLTRETCVQDFRDFYWLKSELQQFCRAHGLSPAGAKQAIAARIEHFLQGDGHAIHKEPSPNRPASEEAARRFNAATAADFSMQTRVPAGARCTQQVRRYFELHVDPRFRFTVTLQQYIRQHPDISFQQIADYWRHETERRKAGTFKPAIASQFEFNQFTRDFHADPANKTATRADCLAAWKRVRQGRGEKKYVPAPRVPSSADGPES
jgi:hypothetical protein